MSLPRRVTPDAKSVRLLVAAMCIALAIVKSISHHDGAPLTPGACACACSCSCSWPGCGFQHAETAAPVGVESKSATATDKLLCRRSHASRHLLGG